MTKLAAAPPRGGNLVGSPETSGAWGAMLVPNDQAGFPCFPLTLALGNRLALHPGKLPPVPCSRKRELVLGLVLLVTPHSLSHELSAHKKASILGQGWPTCHLHGSEQELSQGGPPTSEWGVSIWVAATGTSRTEDKSPK